MASPPPSPANRDRHATAGRPAPAVGTSGWGRVRWIIMILIFLGTLINFIDRQTMSVLAPALEKDLGITNFQYAKIGTVFLLTYSISMSVWGSIFDRLGNRISYSLAILWWSLAEVAHALASGVLSFSFLRGLLGMGESGAWPGAARTVTAWFEPGDRALGIGVSNAGTAIGAAVAAPLIIWIDLRWGWRATFALTGSLGFFWLLAWWLLYPKSEPVREESRPDPALPVLSKRRIFASKKVLGVLLARFLCDPVWWLYVNWLPLYLHNVRGFSLREIGASAWFPFACAGIGSFAGGFFAQAVIRRTGSVALARKSAIVIGGLLMPAGVGAIWVSSPYAALGCMGITLFAFQFWIGNVQSLPTDLVGMRALGLVAGAAGTAAGFGAMIFTLSTGWVVDHFSYTPILVVSGCLAPVASVVLLLTLGKIERIDGTHNPPHPRYADLF